MVGKMDEYFCDHASKGMYPFMMNHTVFCEHGDIIVGTGA